MSKKKYQYRIVSSVNNEDTWYDAVEEINELLNEGWYCLGNPSVVGSEFVQAMMKRSEIEEKP